MTDQEILLSAVMMRPKSWAHVMTLGLTEEFFADPLHRDLWLAMRKTELEGKRHHTASFHQRVKLPGTKVIIEKLAASFQALDASELEKTAKRVVGHCRLAELQLLAKETTTNILSFQIGQEVDRIASATKAMAKLADTLTETRVARAKVGFDMVENYVEFCEKRIQMAANGGLGISSGIKHLDEAFGGGFRPHEFVLVAGRTGVGKTQFGIHATIQAVTAGHKVVFFSSEMTRNALLDRVCSRLSNVDSRSIRRGEMTDQQTDQFFAAIKTLQKNDDLVIYDDFRCRMSAIEAAVELEMRSVKPPAMIVIDYVQNLKTDMVYRDQVGMLKEISSTLKQMAVRFPVAIVALAQLNRESTKFPPDIGHILGCDSFAHDCDGAILLHMTEKMREHDVMSLRLRKMRFGEETNVGVGIRLATSKFTEPTDEQSALLYSLEGK